MRRLFYTVSYLCLVALPETVSAADCMKVPTCAELGYTTAAGSCPAEIKSLTCPFDRTKVYCPEDCRDYKLTSCDTSKGNCVQCGDGDNWKYDSCNTGWYLSGADCAENECAGYPLTVDQCNSTIGTCTSQYCYAGTVAKTYYTSCKEGWTLNTSSRLCDESTCAGFNSTSQTINGCQNTANCKKGNNTLYTCSQCYTGYSLSNGTCSKTCTYTATGLPSHCSAAANCILGSSSGETTYYASTCTTCENGYSLSSSNLCEKKTYAVGEIYYHNGTAIGVVFSDDGNTTKVVGLKNINSSGQEANTYMYWANNSDYSWTTGATLTTDTTTASNDMDGKGNTQKILAYIKANNKTAQAATATSLYAPSVCPSGSICGAGEWYLPSLGELWTMYNNLSTIDTALSSAGGTILNHSSYYYFLSSTEYNASSAWGLNFNNGGRWNYGKYYRLYVRPVLAF